MDKLTLLVFPGIFTSTQGTMKNTLLGKRAGGGNMLRAERFPLLPLLSLRRHDVGRPTRLELGVGRYYHYWCKIRTYCFHVLVLYMKTINNVIRIKEIIRKREPMNNVMFVVIENWRW